MGSVIDLDDFKRKRDSKENPILVTDGRDILSLSTPPSDEEVKAFVDYFSLCFNKLGKDDESNID